MAKALDDLNKAFWKKYKEDAGLKKAGWFKKHAGVGGHIDAFQNARTVYRTTNGETGTVGMASLKAYEKVLGDLSKAFTNFVKAKEFKTEMAKKLQEDIEFWQSELAKKRKQVAALMKTYEKKLETIDADQVRNVAMKQGLC